MGKRQIYCCECQRNNCICSLLFWSFVGILIVIGLAGYGLYKLIWG